MVQVNNEKLFVRVKFKKVGNLQYISHLDLVRTMHKVIVRARLPLWYTEGFNPKPKMIFAAPLSIGTESVCEFVDIRLTERM
jgi:radical SAM-linked protein